MFQKTYEANIPKFFLAHALFNVMFFLPIWAVFVQGKHGLGLTEITLIDSAFWLTMALTEVPTGAVADSWGRKHSMAIGIGISVAAVLLFGLAPSFGALLLANSLWAFAFTFLSGANIAFFYDTLRELGREGEFTKLRGWISATEVIAVSLGGVLGGFLTLVTPETPFYAYAVCLVLAGLVVLLFKEPPRENDTESGVPLSYQQILSVTWKTIRARPNLRYVLLYASLLPIIGPMVVVTFIQPYSINIGIPMAFLGVVLLFLNGARIVGASQADRLGRSLGAWRLLAIAPFLVTVGLLGLGAVPSVLGIGLFTITTITEAATRPTVETVMMGQTPSSVRATILSVDSLISRLMLAGIEPVLGIFGDAYGLSTAFIWAGVVYAGIMLVLLFLWRPRWEEVAV